MRRRQMIAMMGGAAAAWPLATRAQQPAVPVIGFLGATSPPDLGISLTGFEEGLKEAGFVEGRNAAIEYRWAEGNYSRLPKLAADLVRRRVSMIVAATAPAALAAKAATTTTPIVFFSGGDPVEQGLVASFSLPGGNLTGVCVFLNDLGPKRLELLLQLAPTATVIGFLINPDNPNAEFQVSSMLKAAQAGGQQIVVLAARTEADIDAAFARLAERHGDALIVGADPFFGGRDRQIAALALQHRVPATSNGRRFVEGGGIFSYGNDSADAYHQVGVYAGRVLKGARPADLPVVRATKFELFINLKTAKALGLTIPPTLLARADEVFE